MFVRSRCVKEKMQTIIQNVYSDLHNRRNDLHGHEGLCPGHDAYF